MTGWQDSLGSPQWQRRSCAAPSAAAMRRRTDPGTPTPRPTTHRASSRRGLRRFSRRSRSIAFQGGVEGSGSGESDSHGQETARMDGQQSGHALGRLLIAHYRFVSQVEFTERHLVQLAEPNVDEGATSARASHAHEATRLDLSQDGTRRVKAGSSGLARSEKQSRPTVALLRTLDSRVDPARNSR